MCISTSKPLEHKCEPFVLPGRGRRLVKNPHPALKYKVDFWPLYAYIRVVFCKEKENEIYKNAWVGQ